jgi:hypothetical protein
MFMFVASATFDPDPARTRLRVATLDQWAEAGVALAKAVVAQARRDLVEAARRLSRIAQAVRIAIVLAMRLEQPDNPAFQPVPAKARAARAEEPQTEKDTAEKPQGHGERRPPSGDREISDDAILRRPLKDIVKFICNALGLVPDWSLWSETAQAPTAPPPEPPRPKPIPPSPLLQGLSLSRVLDRRLIWTSPTQAEPAPPSLRTRLRCSASPLALDPIAPGASGRSLMSDDARDAAE